MSFANQKFPLSVEPTELPEGVVGDVNFDPLEPEQARELQSPYGFAGDGNDLPPGATEISLMAPSFLISNKTTPVQYIYLCIHHKNKTKDIRRAKQGYTITVINERYSQSKGILHTSQVK